MDFLTHILKSNLAKQLGGATLGVAAAAVIYFIVGQYSASTIKGVLVQTNTVSENANRVRVNDKNIDDATLRLIAQRAQQVASQLDQSTQSAASLSVPSLVAHANERAADRAAAVASLAARQNAPTYAMDPRTGDISTADRLAIRNARIQQLAPSSASSAMVAVITKETTAAASSSAAITAPEGMHSGAPLTESPSHLPSSGMGTVFLVVATLLLTVGIACRRTVAL